MSGLGGFSRGFEDAVSSSDGSSDEVDFDLVSNLAHSPMLAEETHNFLVNDVVMPMVRRSLKRKLLEGRGDGVELNDGHESVMDNVVSSSIKHISLSALYSTLNEGLEMVDLATVLKSDSADKHRPAYLHPYDDGDLSDALKSSLMQAEAVALTKDTEEEGRKREVQNLVNAEVATGISTYIYTQPDGEEVYVVRFDIFPSREDPASTYYAFLELVSVDDDTPVPWVGVRFGAHTAPEFVDVKGVAKQFLGEDGIVDVKDPGIKGKITDFCWEVYKRLWGYEARRCVGERLLASGGGEGGITGLHDKPWELVSFLVPGSLTTELKFAFDEPTSKLPTRVKVELIRDDEVVGGEEEKKHKAWIGKVCKEEGLDGVFKVVEYIGQLEG
ncbi:hypothetical protein TrCOL_g1352 [Triparma columacea]|uniref:Uncharacterized protein n=1 Tax=Triparma columacea TaxID=722753 RepID=A0A9W7G3D3_9STRA|nr:hypothetical protein TrCOL_g1352 [Triparma columacea]